MTRSQHSLLACAALAGLVLSVFQVWYVALPIERAAGLDFCRWTPQIDCFESLNRHGASLLFALAALAAFFFFQSLLAGLAAGAEAGRRDAFLGIACLSSFPTTGLAGYVLLSDYLVAKATSPSAILIALLSLGMNVDAVVRGIGGVRLRPGGRTTLAAVAAAALFGYFLEGAAGSAHEVGRLEAERAAAPPAIRWADFDPDIPRVGAASFGNPLAGVEVLLFLDPAQEASRRLLTEALGLHAQDVLVQVYLKDGVDLALAADPRAYLEAVAQGEPPPEPSVSDDEREAARTLVERQQEAARIEAYPTAIWKGGRRRGEFTLESILAVARPR